MIPNGDLSQHDPRAAGAIRSHGQRSNSRGVFVLVGVLLLVAAAAGLLMLRRGSLEAVTGANFDAARQRWQQAGLADYNLEVQVSGRQAATYFVEVRGGEARTALRNGQPLKRTPSTWTVPGMFYTVSQDVQSVEKVAAGKADAATQYLTLRARFHPQWGYPERYLRVERVKRGANPEVSWVVTRFSAVAP